VGTVQTKKNKAMIRALIGLMLMVLAAAQVPTPTPALQIMRVAINQTVLLQRGGNPSTAYDWVATFDQPSIASASSVFYVSTFTDLSPYTYNITIVGLRPGSTVLTLKYKRSWETVAHVTEQFNIIVDAATTKVTLPARTTTTAAPTTTTTTAPTTTQKITTTAAPTTTTASPTTTITKPPTTTTTVAPTTTTTAVPTTTTTTAAPTTTTTPAPTTTTTSAPTTTQPPTTTTTTAAPTTTQPPTTTTTTAAPTTTVIPTTTTTIPLTPEPTTTTTSAPTPAPTTSAPTVAPTTTSAPAPAVRHIQLNQLFSYVKTVQNDQVGPDLSWTVTINDPTIVSVVVSFLSPSVTIFTISALKAGSASITLEYRSVWGDATVQAIQSEQFTVVVDPATTTSAPSQAPSTAAPTEPIVGGITSPPEATPSPSTTSPVTQDTTPTTTTLTTVAIDTSQQAQSNPTDAPRSSASYLGASFVLVTALSILLVM
jgi:predicted secreted protein